MRSKIIPYGKHYIDERDINAVIKNLKSGSLTQGPTIEKFENKIKEIVNCRYAVAVSSCTAGMHIALLSSGFKKNNTLLTTPISFVSTANASKFCTHQRNPYPKKVIALRNLIVLPKSFEFTKIRRIQATK